MKKLHLKRIRLAPTSLVALLSLTLLTRCADDGASDASSKVSAIGDKVHIGAVIHENRKLVIFEIVNNESVEVMCKMGLTANYVDGDNQSLGYRPVYRYNVMVPAGGSTFKVEAGQKEIEQWELQHRNPKISTVGAMEMQKCCAHSCKTVGEKECVAGKIRECAQVPDECRNWSSFKSCEVGYCATANRCGMPQKKIYITSSSDAGRFDGNLGGIPGADGICRRFFPNTKAMVTDGINRRASVTPFKGDGTIDWVFKPNTRYVNAAGQTVWETDDTPLLGVRNGVGAQNLLNPITTEFYSWGTLHGMVYDWTTPAKGNCSAWTSNADVMEQKGGSSNAVRTDYGGLIDNGGISSCKWKRSIICVEQ